MNRIISIIIIVVVIYGVKKFSDYYAQVKRDTEGAPKTEQAVPPAQQPLPTPQLEQSYQQAKSGGAATFKDWIARYGHMAPEPRRTAIELEYIQILSRSNPAEAKRAFSTLKARVTPDSPLYDQVKKMERTFQ